MKTSPIVITALLLMAIAAGCKPSTDSTGNGVDGPQAPSAKREPGAATTDYTYQQKTEFVNKMNSEIANLKTQSKEMEAKLESCTGSTKAELQSKLTTLRQKVSSLNDQLDKAKNANEGTWNDVKSALQKGTSEAKESFNQARQWLSDKIKP